MPALRKATVATGVEAAAVNTDMAPGLRLAGATVEAAAERLAQAWAVALDATLAGVEAAAVNTDMALDLGETGATAETAAEQLTEASVEASDASGDGDAAKAKG